MDRNLDGGMRRFLEIAKTLEIACVPYFSTTVTGNQMEIPAPFVRDHGKNMKPTASLRLGSGNNVWPVQIQVCYSVRFRVRFCQQWRRFLSDNGLRKGDELIVSLVATSEFVIFMLKKNFDPWKSLRCSLSTNKTSPSSGDFLPEANTSKNKLRIPPLSILTPVEMVETQEGNASDNFQACPVALDRDKCKEQMIPTEGHAETHDRNFNGAITFQKKMSEASTRAFGYPQFSRVEIPADFVQRHGSLLSEGTVITLEGPVPGSLSQVECRYGPTKRRIMWRRGWYNFVTRNELRKGDNLEFTLTAPNRFAVHLRNMSTEFLSLTHRNANVSRNKKGSSAQEGRASPVNCPNRSAAVDQNKNMHFIKTIPATSVSKCTTYPFLVVPTSFWHTVRLPPEVNLQGPNSSKVFSVKCSGKVKAGATKNLACGWRDYAKSNAIRVGDKLRFTYISEPKLFVVDYV